MSVRLFVGNLPYDATEADLREHFSAVAPLSYIYLPLDRETGKPRGFAFIEYSEQSHAQEAIRRFNSQMFKGRPLAVNEPKRIAQRRAPRDTRHGHRSRRGTQLRRAAPPGARISVPTRRPAADESHPEVAPNPSADPKALFARSQADSLSLEATTKKSTMTISAATTSPAALKIRMIKIPSREGERPVSYLILKTES
jgi:RNA recognition motif-containing protein